MTDAKPLRFVRDWTKAIRPVRDEILTSMHEGLGCGPLDGGCLAFARALQLAVGGEVLVLRRASGLADHAVLRVGDRLVDFDGPATQARMIARFNRREHATAVDVSFLSPGDLDEARRSPEVEARIYAILRAALRSNAPVRRGSHEMGRIVADQHHRPQDLEEGDLLDRISAYDAWEETTIPLADVDLDEFAVDPDLVDEYVATIRAGSPPPPPLWDAQARSTVDGVHRLNAMARCGYDRVVVLQGIHLAPLPAPGR